MGWHSNMETVLPLWLIKYARLLKSDFENLGNKEVDFRILEVASQEHLKKNPFNIFFIPSTNTLPMTPLNDVLFVFKQNQHFWSSTSNNQSAAANL